MTLAEILIVLAVMSALSILVYDLNISILTSNLFIEVKNDLSLQGQQAVNQIKNRLISSRLLLADRYNKSTGTWTGVGSYYIDPNILEASSQYPPLPTITPNNTNPGGSEFYNVLARIESRMVNNQTQLVMALVPSSSAQADSGLSAASIGNSILFIETLSSRRVCHQWAYPNAPATTNYLVDTYRLNYYYLHQKEGNPIAGKNYYIDLIQWESVEVADYAQILQIATHIKQTPPATYQNAESPADILNQLKNPATVNVHSSCSAFFAGERKKAPLSYAWNVDKAATNITDPASIRANFYTLNYNNGFNPNNSQTNDDVPLDPVASNFRIPLGKVTNLLPGLDTGAIQARTPYSIAFNNDSSLSAGLYQPIPKNIPHLVPIRFNPYDTSSFASDRFMGGFEIGIVPNATIGYQVNLRLVLMADSSVLHRMIAHETVVLAATRN